MGEGKRGIYAVVPAWWLPYCASMKESVLLAPFLTKRIEQKPHSMHDLRSTILRWIEVPSPGMSLFRTKLLLWAVLLLVLATTSIAQALQTTPPITVVPFTPLEQWRKSILSGDQLLFRSFYSWKPEAVIQNPAGQTDSRDEIAFWNSLKVR